MTDYKLDLFEALDAIDCGDGDWLSRQSEAARREYNAFMLMRWAATLPDGTEAGDRLLAINQRLNIQFAALKDHPDLAFRLTAGCGPHSRRRQPHQLLPPLRQHGTGGAARALLGQYHPMANDRELDLLLSLHSRASFADFLDAAGCTAAEAKGALTAYDRYTGTTQTEGRPKSQSPEQTRQRGRR